MSARKESYELLNHCASLVRYVLLSMPRVLFYSIAGFFFLYVAPVNSNPGLTFKILVVGMFLFGASLYVKFVLLLSGVLLLMSDALPSSNVNCDMLESRTIYVGNCMWSPARE